VTAPMNPDTFDSEIALLIPGDQVNRIVDYIERHPGVDMAELEQITELSAGKVTAAVILADRLGRIEMVKHPQRWRFYPTESHIERRGGVMEKAATTPPSPVRLMEEVWLAARAVADCAGIHHLGSIEPEVARLAEAIDAYDRQIDAIVSALDSGSSTPTTKES
jgi:hypothetical protein